MFLAASILRKYFLSTAYSESQKDSDKQRRIRQQGNQALFELPPQHLP